MPTNATQIFKINSTIYLLDSFIIYCEERNLFLRADSLKNMEKWSRAIEMQADYARGGDGTSMLSNPNQATEPKKRIRQNHSLLSELDRATKALEFLEKEAHHCDAAGTDSLESSVGTDSNEVQVSLSDQPQSGPQTATNSDRVQKISSRAADPRLDESFESVDIVEPVVVRVRAGKSSKAAPRHFQPTHAPVRRQLDDNYSGDDVYSGERSKASSMCIRGPSPKDNGKEEPIRTGWM
ncbi:unnamed protein product [Symbiodinium microadriaticum]|nr:unnamed protein product [Symbiodinium microadriaticum]